MILDKILQAISSHTMLELTGCHRCGKRFMEGDVSTAHNGHGIYCQSCFPLYLKELGITEVPFEECTFGH